jgi:hypothetical protein
VRVWPQKWLTQFKLMRNVEVTCIKRRCSLKATALPCGVLGVDTALPQI